MTDAVRLDLFDSIQVIFQNLTTLQNTFTQTVTHTYTDKGVEQAKSAKQICLKRNLSML